VVARPQHFQVHWTIKVVLIGKNVSTGNLTISASGGDTIEGASTAVLLPNTVGTIVSDGGQWLVLDVTTIGGGGLISAYVAVTTTYTVLLTDNIVDCTSGTFTVNLPTAVGYEGLTFTIKNSGTGLITVDPNGSQTIDGDTTKILTQYDSMTIVSNNANWIII